MLGPVTFPDFTRGLWNKEKGYHHLNKVITKAVAAAEKTIKQ